MCGKINSSNCEIQAIFMFVWQKILILFSFDTMYVS